MTEKSEAFLLFLKERFPDAKCALSFRNDFECLIAIILSAQATDISVNKVTPALFEAYPSYIEMGEASLSSIEAKIHSIGLYRNKAKNIIACSKELTRIGYIPKTRKDLEALPGVGSKTAGVFLLERALVPAIPVDTHVGRIAVRLGYSKENDSPLEKERALEKAFPKEDWIFLHHAIIYFGRNICHSKNPSCLDCPMKQYCRYLKKISSIKGK